MKKLINSSNYVIYQMSYNKAQYKGKDTAYASRETLLNEIEGANEISSKLGKQGEMLSLMLIELSCALDNIIVEKDYESHPLNTVLTEYVIFQQEKINEFYTEILAS
jgi:hypothetical protein